MPKGLGRGFDALIPTELIDDDFDLTAAEDEKISRLSEVKVGEIQRDSSQPRQNFDQQALAELAQSIKEHGVLQPLVLTPVKGKGAIKYQIVAGERRWRAAKEAGLKTVPALIRSLSGQASLEISIIENAQRADLNAIELATAYAKLKSQFNLEDEQIAQRVGKSKGSVANTLRLLKLPDFAKQAILEHDLKEAVMRALVGADEAMIKKILPHIINDGWSQHKVEQYLAAHKVKSSVSLAKQSLYAREERALGKKYNAEVYIRGRNLRFSCKSDAEMKKLIKLLSA